MLKEVKTPQLSIAYEENGNENARVVLLLHGFPYDAKNWKQVSDVLVEKGYRTIAPYNRGFGKTNFLSDEHMRSGQYTALVSDVVAFCKALQVENFFIIGHDWGSTTAFKIAALYPQKVNAVVALATAYNGNEKPELSLQQIQAFWYQWYFNTQQGYDELKKKRKEFCRYLWTVWSPTWKFEAKEFENTAASWNNPDFVDIVIHSYRHRYQNAESDTQYEQLEKQLKQKPEVTVPAIFLQGDKDGASLPESSLHKEKFFTNFYERRIIEGSGHLIQNENPQAVVKAFDDVAVLIQKR